MLIWQNMCHWHIESTTSSTKSNVFRAYAGLINAFRLTCITITLLTDFRMSAVCLRVIVSPAFTTSVRLSPPITSSPFPSHPSCSLSHSQLKVCLPVLRYGRSFNAPLLDHEQEKPLRLCVPNPFKTDTDSYFPQQIAVAQLVTPR